MMIQGIPTGSKFEYFSTGKWESPAKHLRVWGKWQIWAEPAGTTYGMDSSIMRSTRGQKSQ